MTGKASRAIIQVLRKTGISKIEKKIELNKLINADRSIARFIRIMT